MATTSTCAPSFHLHMPEQSSRAADLTPEERFRQLAAMLARGVRRHRSLALRYESDALDEPGGHRTPWRGSMITVKRKLQLQRTERGRRRIKKASPAAEIVEPGRIPRISRLMALAIRFDRLIREGAVPDQSELARLAHGRWSISRSPSRRNICQHTWLLALARRCGTNGAACPRIVVVY